jgi:NodT family efflux transporter outer membrane factor (OMF) lipoprotein
VAPWWLAFENADLSATIEQALVQNLTLAQGLQRIQRATALVRQERAALLPQIDFDAEGAQVWEKNLDLDTSRASRPDGFTPPSSTEPSPSEALPKQTADSESPGGSTGSGDGESSTPDDETWETEFAAGLSLSWELDLWGRLRALAAAQGEELAASIHDYEALRLLLSSELAEAWFAALEQRLQLQLLDEQLELAGTYLELIELRFVQGDASIVDVLQQRSQVAEIEAEVPIAQSLLRLQENRLDVLAGQAPDGQDRTSTQPLLLPQTAHLPPVTIPLALLQQRPDLRALQHQVTAADYRIAAAIAERLPRVTLEGSFLYSDGSGDATLTGLGGATLFQPLLDWGARKAAVDATRSLFEETLLLFSQNYLEAIEEVETTLWQEARQRELIEALVRREEILERTVEESRVRYSLGVTDYLPVLTALSALQDIQREIITERRALVGLRVRLFGAVGAATYRPVDVARVHPDTQDMTNTGHNGVSTGVENSERAMP